MRLRGPLAFLFASFLWITAAFGQYVTPVQMRDANLATSNTQNYITTAQPFTAPRTLTIPDRSSLNAYFIQFIDTAGAISGTNTLTIQVSGGQLINGQSTLTLSGPGVYVFFAPSANGYQANIVYPSSGSGNPAGGTNGQVQYNNNGSLGGFTVSGDATLNTANGALTLATVNSNTGSFGSTTQCTTFTTNAKGLITAASQATCAPAIGNISGLGAGVATALGNATNASGGFPTVPVANAQLANASTTVNGTSCTLGSSCSPTAAPSGTAGGDLTGTYPNPTLAGIITAGGPTGSATVAPIITYDAKGRLTVVSSATITPAIGSITGLGTGVGIAAATALSANGGLTTTIASGTTALGTDAISSATCATAVTGTATNTATTDVITAVFNGDPTAVTGYIPSVSGMLTIFVYPTANTVNFKVCNNTGASITPGAITLNWRVTR